MHPYDKHREHGKSHKRVHTMHKHLARGGHSDEAADQAMISAAMRTHENKMHKGKHTDLKVHGKKHGGRLDKFARGGRTKSKGTHINIVNVAPHGRHPAMGAAPAVPPGPPPAGGGLPMPPPGMGAGPPGMPPGMPMKPPGVMKRGGKVYARGGKVHMTAGAIAGEGRKQKIKAYGKNARIQSK